MWTNDFLELLLLFPNIFANLDKSTVTERKVAINLAMWILYTYSYKSFKHLAILVYCNNDESILYTMEFQNVMSKSVLSTFQVVFAKKYRFCFP